MKSIKNQEVLEGFQVLDEISRNDFVTLYRAQRDSDGKKLVLKLFSEPLGHRTAFRDQFLKSAESLAKNPHEHILPILSYGRLKNRYYTIQEALPSLTNVLADTQDTLSLADSLYIIKCIAAALGHAAYSGIIHGNICPNNIFFQPDGNIVVSDFGCRLAINMCMPTADEKISVQRATYLSPEGVTRSPLNAQSDLYSLGIIFYELLTGQAPFLAKHPHSILAKHANAELPALPNKLLCYQEILDRLVAKDPKNRYPSPLWLYNALTGNKTAPSKTASKPVDTSPNDAKLAHQSQSDNSNNSNQPKKKIKPLGYGLLACTLAFASANIIHTFLTTQTTSSDQISIDVPIQTQTASLAITTKVHAGSPSTNIALSKNTINSNAQMATALNAQHKTSDPKITALLNRAEIQWQQKQLFSPPQNNVYDTYQQLNQLDATNDQTAALITQLRNHVIDKANTYAEAQQWGSAIATLDEALSVMKGDEAIFTAKNRISTRWSDHQQQQSQLEILIAQAEQQLNQGKLIKPEGDNTYASLTQALSIDAKHAGARTVLGKLSETLADQSAALLDARQYDASLKRATEGLQVNPNHAELTSIAAKAQRALAQQRIDYQTLLAEVAQHKTSQRYTQPENNNALHAFTVYSNKYPTDERVQSGINDIALELVEAGEAEYRDEHLQAAGHWVDQALYIAPNNADARALKNRIQKHITAREQAAAAARKRAERRAKAKQRQQQNQNTTENTQSIRKLSGADRIAPIQGAPNAISATPSANKSAAQITQPPNATNGPEPTEEKKIRFFGTF